MTLRIGIDTGGTFTDIVCVDDASGAMRVTKVSSTPPNPAIALVRGVHAILGESGASIDDLAVLAHGTTVATNALLQGEIAGLGLIVTDGFRHILEIARQAVPEGYGNSYFWVKPERIVPLRYVREIGGRLNFLGEELRPLDEDSVRAAARFFRDAGISAVGICLLHSYANPAHERRAAAIVREEYPDCTLSLSCDVLPEYREYERAVTTLVDAFIKPHMSRYLDRIRDELGPELNKKPFLVMQSSGGVASPDQVMRKPITTALSRPGRRRARQRGDRRDRRLSRSGHARRRRHLDRSLPDRSAPSRRSPMAATSAVSRCAFRCSTCAPSAPAAARSPGLRAKANCASARAAPAPCRGRCAIRTAATSRRSPTPISFSAAFRRR